MREYATIGRSAQFQNIIASARGQLAREVLEFTRLKKEPMPLDPIQRRARQVYFLDEPGRIKEQVRIVRNLCQRHDA